MTRPPQLFIYTGIKSLVTRFTFGNNDSTPQMRYMRNIIQQGWQSPDNFRKNETLDLLIFIHNIASRPEAVLHTISKPEKKAHSKLINRCPSWNRVQSFPESQDIKKKRQKMKVRTEILIQRFYKPSTESIRGCSKHQLKYEACIDVPILEWEFIQGVMGQLNYIKGETKL